MARLSNKRKLYKRLRRIDPNFNKLVYQTLDRYDELSLRYYRHQDVFYDQIHLDTHLTYDNKEYEQLLKIERLYKKVLETPQKPMIGEDLLNIDGVSQELSDLDNVLPDSNDAELHE